MIDDEKARITGRRTDGAQERLTVGNIAGDLFEIMRPPISEAGESDCGGRIGRVTGGGRQGSLSLFSQSTLAHGYSVLSPRISDDVVVICSDRCVDARDTPD